MLHNFRLLTDKASAACGGVNSNCLSQTGAAGALPCGRCLLLAVRIFGLGIEVCSNRSPGRDVGPHNRWRMRSAGRCRTVENRTETPAKAADCKGKKISQAFGKDAERSNAPASYSSSANRFPALKASVVICSNSAGLNSPLIALIA